MVCGATHELSDTNSIDPKELRSLKFVVRESTSSLRVTLDQELPKIGIKSLPISMEVGSTKAIMEILQHGQHVSFLPKFAVRETCNKGLLHLIEIQGLSIKNTLWIARTNATLNNKVADNFINLLHAWYLKSS